MAPLPHNNTGIFYLDYSVASYDHTLEIRFGTGSSALEAQSVAQALLSAVESQLYTLTIVGARVQDIGTNVSYPVPWTGDSVYGSGDDGPYTSALFMDFVGRSLDGRRCRLAIFGSKATVDTTDFNFRTSVAVGWVAAGLAALESLPECPVSISGQVVNWKQYANGGTNAYWRNKIR